MVCSVISCISKDGEDDSIGQIVEAELCPLLVELLRHRNPRVQAASVRALGNLVSGDDERHTQAVLDCAVLPQLLLVLENQNHMWETRSDICWMLSNIAVGSLEQIEQLIESELIPTLVALLEEQNDHIDVRTEAAWVVSNSAASGSRAQIKYLVSQRCIHVLCNLLVLSEDSDLEMVNGVLHALENILEAGAAEAAQQMAMLREQSRQFQQIMHNQSQNIMQQPVPPPEPRYRCEDLSLAELKLERERISRGYREAALQMLLKDPNPSASTQIRIKQLQLLPLQHQVRGQLAGIFEKNHGTDAILQWFEGKKRFQAEVERGIKRAAKAKADEAKKQTKVTRSFFDDMFKHGDRMRELVKKSKQTARRDRTKMDKWHNDRIRDDKKLWVYTSKNEPQLDFPGCV